jgi:hypothetical protein
VFLVRSFLLVSRSTVRWEDWDVQMVFGGEQQPFGTSVCGPMGRLGCSDRVLWCATAFWLVGQLSNLRNLIFRHYLVVSSCLFWAVSGPMGGFGCSDSVLC